MAQWRKVIVSGSDAELNTLQVGGGSGGSGVTVSTVGAVTADASITAGSSFIIGSADINETDLEKLDGITNGTAAANKAVVLDGSKNIATIGTIGCGAITSTGTSTFATACSPDAVGGADLGSTGAEWGDIYIADDKKIKFGNDQDVTIEYDEDGTDELRFAGNAVTFEQAVTFDGAVTLGNATGDSITVLGNSTFSGTTIANLGTVSAATSITATDLIGTNIDGILGADTARAITGTTIDATTDFTIDGLVLTADTITNDAALTVVSTGLTLNASLDIALSADGGNVTMDDGTITVFDFNTDTPELKIMDDAQVANYTSIAVGDNGATTFTTVDADAAAANLLFTIDGTVDIDSAGLMTLDSGGNIALEPAGGSHIKLDDVIQVDSGVVTGATSITSTNFVGIIGASGTAAGTFTTCDATTDFTIGSTVITDDSIVMTPTSGDTATFAATTNGALAITTVDTAAAAANITITADGTFEAIGTTVTLDSGGNIALEPAGGSHIKLDDVIQVDSGVVTGATSITSTAFVGTLDGVVGGNTPAAGTFTTLSATGNATITGDLTVNGTTTTLATTNLAVGDAFIFAATGSAAANVDAGLIVQSGSAVDSGSAIYHDINSERWAVAKGVGSDWTAVTPKQMVVTTVVSASSPHSSYGEYGVGEMWLETDSQDIWIRTS